MRDSAQIPKKDFSINRDMNDHETADLGPRKKDRREKR